MSVCCETRLTPDSLGDLLLSSAWLNHRIQRFCSRLAIGAVTRIELGCYAVPRYLNSNMLLCFSFSALILCVQLSGKARTFLIRSTVTSGLCICAGWRMRTSAISLRKCHSRCTTRSLNLSEVRRAASASASNSPPA